PAWDAAEAEALYDLLEHKVVPEFYTRNKQGIPTAWVGRMRESMARLTPQYSANRTVREYTEQHYLPAAARYHARAARKGAAGAQIVNWQHDLEQKWGLIRLDDLQVATRGGQCLFEITVHLNELEPKFLRVELYADGAMGNPPVRQEMKRLRQKTGAADGYVYRTTVPATRPSTDYTVRVTPQRAGVGVPLEVKQILWQR
ncbi:MAG: DUF3417 domain-containing protein, partial [Anaerolineae bacterium]|nr:DUF3417 domain-containing protein [Anaerolineae bacterium]